MEESVNQGTPMCFFVQKISTGGNFSVHFANCDRPNSYKNRWTN